MPVTMQTSLSGVGYRGNNMSLSAFLSNQFLNETPEAAYRRKYKQAGSDTGFCNWLNNQYQNQYTNYLSGMPDNPNQLWTDFLEQGDLTKSFENLSYKQRGLNPGLYTGSGITYKPQKYGL